MEKGTLPFLVFFFFFMLLAVLISRGNIETRGERTKGRDIGKSRVTFRRYLSIITSFPVNAFVEGVRVGKIVIRKLLRARARVVHLVQNRSTHHALGTYQPDRQE